MFIIMRLKDPHTEDVNKVCAHWDLWRYSRQKLYYINSMLNPKFRKGCQLISSSIFFKNSIFSIFAIKPINKYLLMWITILV